MRALFLKALVVVTMAVGLIPTLGVTQAVACDCAMLSDRRQAERADVVFSGTLSSRAEPREVHSSADPATFTFRVDRVYKGEAFTKQEVLSAVSGASCGLEITGTGPFLVFAERKDDSQRLVASMCSGTRELGSGPQNALGRGAYPAAAPVSASGSEGSSAPFAEGTTRVVDDDTNLVAKVVVSVVVIGVGLLALLCLCVLLLPPWRRRTRT